MWLSSSSCLHTCAMCALYSCWGDKIAGSVCPKTKEGNEQFNMVSISDLKLCAWFKHILLVNTKTMCLLCDYSEKIHTGG